MGAGILRNKVKKAGIDVAVTNMAIANLPADAEVVITHKDLTDRAKEKAPNAYHVSVENFLNSPKYDELLEKLRIIIRNSKTRPNYGLSFANGKKMQHQWGVYDVYFSS